MDHQQYIKRALQLAAKAALGEASGLPQGAVIVYAHNGNIVAEGYDQTIAKNDPTAHAELTAIRVACDYFKTRTLSQCVMYTATYPSPLAREAARLAQLNTIFYCRSNQLNHQPLPTTPLYACVTNTVPETDELLKKLYD